MKDSSYAAGSKQKNLISGNTVASPGGDGIYLQSVNATSTAEKHIKIHDWLRNSCEIRKNISVLNNSCSSNKEHGVKIEYAQGGIRVKVTALFPTERAEFCCGNQKQQKFPEIRLQK